MFLNLPLKLFALVERLLKDPKYGYYFYLFLFFVGLVTVLLLLCTFLSSSTICEELHLVGFFGEFYKITFTFLDLGDFSACTLRYVFGFLRIVYLLMLQFYINCILCVLHSKLFYSFSPSFPILFSSELPNFFFNLRIIF